MLCVIVVIIIFSAITHYIIKASKLLVGITPELEKNNEKKRFTIARKKYSNTILEDKKFIKKTYKQYVKDYQRKYPNSRYYLLRIRSNNDVAKLRQKIKSHDREEFITKKYKKMY